MRAHNGFLVQAGCLSLVFTAEQLVPELVRWIHDPAVVEKEYSEKYLQPQPEHGTIGLAEERAAYGQEAPSLNVRRR